MKNHQQKKTKQQLETKINPRHDQWLPGIFIFMTHFRQFHPPSAALLWEGTTRRTQLNIRRFYVHLSCLKKKQQFIFNKNNESWPHSSSYPLQMATSGVITLPTQTVHYFTMRETPQIYHRSAVFLIPQNG